MSVDAIIVYRILKILVTPWVDQPAYKEGFIDARGRVLKKKFSFNGSYTILHRFVFNLKRLIGMVPGGNSKIGTWAAALLLLREDSKYINEINTIFEDSVDEQFGEMLEDGESFVAPTNNISSGAIDITPHWITGDKKHKKVSRDGAIKNQ